MAEQEVTVRNSQAEVRKSAQCNKSHSDAISKKENSKFYGRHSENMQSQNRVGARRLDTGDANARSCARHLTTTTSKVNAKPDSCKENNKKEIMEKAVYRRV